MKQYSEWEETVLRTGKSREGTMMHKSRCIDDMRDRLGYSFEKVEAKWLEHVADPQWPRDENGPDHSPFQLMAEPDSKIYWHDEYSTGKRIATSTKPGGKVDDAQVAKWRRKLIEGQHGDEDAENDRQTIARNLAGGDFASGSAIAGRIDELMPETTDVQDEEPEEAEEAVIIDPEADAKAAAKQLKKPKTFDRDAKLPEARVSWLQGPKGYRTILAKEPAAWILLETKPRRAGTSSRICHLVVAAHVYVLEYFEEHMKGAAQHSLEKKQGTAASEKVPKPVATPMAGKTGREVADIGAPRKRLRKGD
eukprot:6491634-Amphidinium_carterae.1